MPLAQQQSDGASGGNRLVPDVLLEYGKLIGKKVICDPNVAGQFYSPATPDLPDEKRAELIEKSLFLDGYQLFDAGEDVVAVLGVGKMSRCMGLPVYTKVEEIPHNERVFSYVVKVQNRDASALASLLGQYILPSSYTSFTPDNGSHTIIVTAQTSIVRRVLLLLPILDVPANPQQG